MTAAPSGWLTEDGLNGLEAALADYYWGDIRAGHIASLFTMARAALTLQAAQDAANALPLSTAMQMARERTEAGQETWVWALVLTGRTDRWLARLREGTWQWTVEEGRRIEWFTMGLHHPHMVENAACRLVTPAEGEALLRGGE